MPSDFVGRSTELALLRKRLGQVTASGRGTAVAIRGRRQVGKSRLVQEFCDAAQAPYVFVTATKGASPVESVASLVAELKDSSLPADADLVAEPSPGSWPDAFRTLAAALPARPSVVVLDELPWLAEQDGLFEGALQTAWDRLLSSRPVLLLLLGGDLHMMERLTAYDRPFHGRADSLVLSPLNPAETALAVDLDGVGAIDAYLVSGGLPGILRHWPTGTSALDVVEQACADPASPLFSVPEATLNAEFPVPDQARRVLEAVGSGDRTCANIAPSAGGRTGALQSGSLSPLLRMLVGDKRVLASDEPLSTQAGKPALFRVADTNLHFYLAALRSAHELVKRGRSESAARLVRRRWATWRGRAVEPLIRESLELAAAAETVPWPEAEAVCGWWNRRFDPEVHLVGADRAPVAREIYFAGSIKWLSSPFDSHDLAVLRANALAVPGFVPGESGLVVVSLSGTAPGMKLADLDVVWEPEDVLDAWRSEPT